MKAHIHTLPLLLVLLTAASCRRDVPADDGGRPITIGMEASGLEDVTQTRAAYTATVPNAGAPLAAYVWASTTSCTYPHGPNDGSSMYNYVLTRHGYTIFNGEYAQMDKNGGNRTMEYPVNGKLTPEVYFVGLSPATDNAGNPNLDSWDYDEGTHKASFDFNGAQDVMFAPEVSGHYTGDIPILHFYHVLTHLRFIIRCEGDTAEEREEVAYAWGMLKNIKLTGQNDNADAPSTHVDVDLSTVSKNASQVLAHCAFSSSEAYLPIYQKGTDSTPFPQNPAAVDNPSKWYGLPTGEDGEEVAWLLCAPVTASFKVLGAFTDEYTLTLNTEKRSNVSVGIDLKTGASNYFSGSTMGCEFVVTLTFRFGKVIASAVAMYDWSQAGGQTMIPITDQ